MSAEKAGTGATGIEQSASRDHQGELPAGGSPLSVRDRGRLWVTLGLIVVLALGLALRLYGIEWDDGLLFHPDERQVLLVTDDISFPLGSEWSSLFAVESPLNPGFFAYGSFPIYLLRALASAAGLLIRPELATLIDIHLVGRALSALFDLGTVLMVFLLGRRLYDRWVALLGALLTSLTVLHIQLAHFYTVDTVLTFFVLWTVYLLVRFVQQPRQRAVWGIAVVWGLALATKVSAGALAIPMAAAWIAAVYATPESDRWQVDGRRWVKAVSGILLTGVMAIGFFLLFEPYAAIDLVTFAVDVITEGFMASGYHDVPYTRQYIGTLPYLYPLRQLVVWSMGIPLGVAGLLGVVAAIIAAVRHARLREWQRFSLLLVPLLWLLVYFGLTGRFHAKFLRYMLPITPLLCLWASWLLLLLVRRAWLSVSAARIGSVVLASLVMMGTLAYALAFSNVYRQEHPWIKMTRWICENVPSSRVVMIEHWDDPLPLIQTSGELDCSDHLLFAEFPAYARDDTVKWQELQSYLLSADYISLSSNRLYNTIPRLPERYPLASRYYELLMSEQLGFELVHYETVHPMLFGLRLIDDTFLDPDLSQPALYSEREVQISSLNLGRADESFTVYDHPKPLLFQKTKHLSLAEVQALFEDVVDDLPEPLPPDAP